MTTNNTTYFINLPFRINNNYSYLHRVLLGRSNILLGSSNFLLASSYFKRNKHSLIPQDGINEIEKRLVINSTPDNIVFNEKGKSLLFLYSIDLHDLCHTCITDYDKHNERIELKNKILHYEINKVLNNQDEGEYVWDLDIYMQTISDRTCLEDLYIYEYDNYIFRVDNEDIEKNSVTLTKSEFGYKKYLSVNLKIDKSILGDSHKLELLIDRFLFRLRNELRIIQADIHVQDHIKTNRKTFVVITKLNKTKSNKTSLESELNSDSLLKNNTTMLIGDGINKNSTSLISYKGEKNLFTNYSNFNIKSFKPFSSKNRFYSTLTNKDDAMLASQKKLLASSFSPSYNAVYDIINNTSFSLMEKQVKIEDCIREYWKIEFYNIISNKRSLGLDNVGIQMIAKQLNNLDEDFTLVLNKSGYASKKYMQTIKNMKSGIIVSIVMGKLIPFALKYRNLDEQPITKLIIDVAEAIFKEYVYEVYIKDLKDKVINDKIKIKEYMEIKNLKMNEEDLSRMGLDFVSYFCRVSNFVELKEVQIKKNTFARYILPKEDLTKFFENFTFIDSDEIPMLVKPLPWKINGEGEILEYGGTYSNNKYQLKPLISNTYKNPISKKTIFNSNYINTINNLSSNGYSINKDVFDIITNKEYYTKDNNRLVNFKPHEETSVLSNYINKKNNIKTNEIVSYNSKYLYDTSIINIARLMLNVEEFYLTVFADWRGRIYTSHSVLNMQGGELARGLLMFSKGEVLNDKGLRALKIYTANAFGLDKKSKNERLDWVNEHFNDIINIPNNNLWLSADEPILFLACCLELQKYNKDHNFISKMPILLDATCNGLQHLSGIANDISLAERVNIYPSTDENAPNDIYSDLIQPIKESIKKLVEEKPQHYNLLYLNIKRKLIKRGIMTITYGVTVKGILDQLLTEHFFKFGLVDKHYIYRPKNDELGDVNLTYKDLYALSHIIYNTLFKSHPTLNIIMEYFQDMVKLMNDLNLPVQWITPYGLIIKQEYCKFTKYDITSTMLGKRRKITLSKYEINSENKRLINKNKQINSFIPNFIHSMDASNIVLLINRVSKDFHFGVVTIHDCFGVHANNVEILSYLVKESFIAIYGEKKSIERFHFHMLENIKAVHILDEDVVINEKGERFNIPKKPVLGEMDLKTQLLESKYFIN